MIIVLSPAKRLDLPENPLPGNNNPVFHNKSIPLIRKLRRLSKPKLMELMDISPALAKLNADRYDRFREDVAEAELYPAIHTFKGDVYLGINANELNQQGLKYADERVRILSGLYGYLRPLDLIQPYRLEMGTKLKVGRKANLYEYWKKDVTTTLKQDLEKTEDPVLINLASHEYFAVIDTKLLNARIVNIHFREYRNGKLRAIQFNLKRARGLITRFAIDNRIKEANQLKAFNYDRYAMDFEMSDENNWYFTR